MARKESTPFPTPPDKLRKSAVQRRIEEQFGQPVKELLDSLHNGDQKMTIGQINEYLKISGAYMLMKKLGVEVRSLKEGKQELWKNPDKLKRTYETGVRSQAVIQRAQEAARQRTERIAEEKKRKATEAASQVEPKPRKSPAERHIEERFGVPAKELLHRLYGEGMSIQRLNEYLGITSARKLMKRLGIPIRTPKEANQELWTNPGKLKIIHETGIRSPAVIQRADEERRFSQSLSEEERSHYKSLSKTDKTLYKFGKKVPIGTALRTERLKGGKVVGLEIVDGTCRATVEFPGGLRMVVPENLIGTKYIIDNSDEKVKTPFDDVIARLRYARDQSHSFKSDSPPPDIRKEMDLADHSNKRVK